MLRLLKGKGSMTPILGGGGQERGNCLCTIKVLTYLLDDEVNSRPV